MTVHSAPALRPDEFVGELGGDVVAELLRRMLAEADGPIRRRWVCAQRHLQQRTASITTAALFGLSLDRGAAPGSWEVAEQRASILRKHSLLSQPGM
jgi:hypothetical protein